MSAYKQTTDGAQSEGTKVGGMQGEMFAFPRQHSRDSIPLTNSVGLLPHLLPPFWPIVLLLLGSRPCLFSDPHTDVLVAKRVSN